MEQSRSLGDDKVKALLIDPDAREIREVECARGLQPIYDLIGAETFDVVTLGGGDALYVDDIGMIRRPQPTPFLLVGYGPLYGKALCLGYDDDGDSVDAHASLDSLRRSVRFAAVAQ